MPVSARGNIGEQLIYHGSHLRLVARILIEPESATVFVNGRSDNPRSLRESQLSMLQVRRHIPTVHRCVVEDVSRFRYWLSGYDSGRNPVPRKRVLKNSYEIFYFDSAVPLNVNDLRAMAGRHTLYFDSCAAHYAKDQKGEKDVFGVHVCAIAEIMWESA